MVLPKVVWISSAQGFVINLDQAPELGGLLLSNRSTFYEGDLSKAKIDCKLNTQTKY